jgi:hypothetical protein
MFKEKAAKLRKEATIRIYHNPQVIKGKRQNAGPVVTLPMATRIRDL